MKRNANIHAAVLLLAATMAAPACAGDKALAALADETGLSQQQVRMVLGPRTARAEYRTSYDRVERKFKAALGEQRYQDLLAGRTIVLHDAFASDRRHDRSTN